MAAPDAPGAVDDLAVDGLPRQVPTLAAPMIGAAWNGRENAVILTHEGECVALPVETAIALRDALSIAIDIPRRASTLARDP